ncbi:glutamine-rich protein 2-like [Prorops nasuta]|uniref:glutamine-rich protein 2-like n=1 Tax=Prorops nasuta TaxID=863751 RepID=UPI0034CD8757
MKKTSTKLNIKDKAKMSTTTIQSTLIESLKTEYFIDTDSQISLAQLLDLALGTPEIGAVNFKILHSFLRVLLQLINLSDIKVQCRREKEIAGSGSNISINVYPNQYSLNDQREENMLHYVKYKTINFTTEMNNNVKIPKLEKKSIEDLAKQKIRKPRRIRGGADEPKPEDIPIIETSEAEENYEVPSPKDIDKPGNTTPITDAVSFAEMDVSEVQRSLDYLRSEVLRMQVENQDLRAEVEQNSANIENLKVELKKSCRSDADNESLESKLNNYVESSKKFESKFEETLSDIINRMKEAEKKIGKMNDTIENGSILKKVETAIQEISNHVEEIQGDIEELNKVSDRLRDMKDEQEMNFSSLMEQIELLKNVKFDKEDLEDALADKADVQIVNQKVSLDQFHTVCDGLTRGLEEAIDKLSKQEVVCQETFSEMQRDIEIKTDKEETASFKILVENRMKILQRKIKELSELNRDKEAAASKKLLRDVQCISCDKDVVMKRQEDARYVSKPFPCKTSMKPYLTYKLDDIRRQQTEMSYSRNMVHFESVMREEDKRIRLAKDNDFNKHAGDVFCNRYCGGSHTVTTPQQRAAKMNRNFTEWGPQVIQLTAEHIEGKDGRLYRSRSIPKKEMSCTCHSPIPVNPTPSEKDASTPLPLAEEPNRASVTSAKNNSKKSIQSTGKGTANNLPAQKLDTKKDEQVKIEPEEVSGNIDSTKENINVESENDVEEEYIHV